MHGLNSELYAYNNSLVIMKRTSHNNVPNANASTAMLSRSSWISSSGICETEAGEGGDRRRKRKAW